VLERAPFASAPLEVEAPMETWFVMTAAPLEHDHCTTQLHLCLARCTCSAISANHTVLHFHTF
jgi:hypothetical protein